jgi:hypothetical protein
VASPLNRKSVLLSCIQCLHNSSNPNSATGVIWLFGI